MTPQPGTAGTDDDPLDAIETTELVVNGEVIDTLVGLAFDSANQTDGVLRFDGTGSTNGITDGSAKVIVNGTVHDVAGAEWVDQSGTKHTVDSWEKVVNSQFDVTITSVSPDPVAPGNTLDVTVDITNNGTDSDTQTVTLDIDNGVGQVDSASVTLSGGASVTKTLSWSVPSGQTEQDYQATVSSADDTASQTVTVISVTVVDDFEDNNLAEYSEPNTNMFSTTSTNAGEGTYALKVGQVSGSGQPQLLSKQTDGLNYYPQKGDVVSGLGRPLVGSSASVNPSYMVGCESVNAGVAGYAAFVDANSNVIRIQRLDDDGSGGFIYNVLASDSVTITEDEWYDLELQWHDGSGPEPDNTLKLTVYEWDVSQQERGAQVGSTISVQDSTYATNRAVGWWTASSDTVAGTMADYLRKRKEVSDL